MLQLAVLDEKIKSACRYGLQYVATVHVKGMRRGVTLCNEGEQLGADLKRISNLTDARPAVSMTEGSRRARPCVKIVSCPTKAIGKQSCSDLLARRRS